jgi:hypothetical protein
VAVDVLGDDPREHRILENGRFVAFDSTASNLVAGDTNGESDAFVRDRVARTTERVSVGSTGLEANDDSYEASISADARFVAFDSDASNLVGGETNGRADAFVRDRAAGTTDRVSVSSAGVQANAGVGDPDFGPSSLAIGADGRFVAFESDASNLVAGDRNGLMDVFVRDRVARTTTLVSVGRKVALRAGALTLQPWPARAGKRLSATMAISAGGAPVAMARVTCAATLSGRKLPPSARSFRAGSARCAWRIPISARGAHLKASVSATTADGTASRRFAATVR